MYDNKNNDVNGFYDPQNPYLDNSQYHHVPYTPQGDSGYYRHGNTQWQHPDQQPQSPDRNPRDKRGKSKAPRYIAMMAAMAVISSAAGGGAAMWVLNNAQITPASSGHSTIVQTATSDKVVAAEDGSVAAVAEKAANSVVEIDTQVVQSGGWMGTSVTPGAGSGVIVSEDGYIVTNNHVVESTESIIVRTKDGVEYKAALVGADAKTDLAVLKVDATGLQSVTFADSDKARVGELAVAIGNPLGELGGTVTSGIISATGREIAIGGESMTLLQTSAAVNPGNSGGGLFDANGHLVGIVNAKSSGLDVEGLAFAIPSNTVKEVLVELIDNGYVSGRPQMGVSVVEVGDARTAARYGVKKAGVYIADPGENAGLKAGDRLVFIAGESISSSADVTKVLQKQNVGDTLDVTVERDGKEVKTQVTLAEQIPEGVGKSTDPV